MNDTAARELYVLISEMNKVFKKGSGDEILKTTSLANDFAELIVKVSGLFRDSRDDVMQVKFLDEKRVDTLLDRLNSVQNAVLNALAKRGVGGTTGPLVQDVELERLLGIAEQIENAGVASVPAVTREKMILETESLIADVKNWEMEDYAKHTLLMQLNHVTRVIQAADTYSASELRYHVKAIIADFASEFTTMDKKYQTHLERLVLWARRGFFAGTIYLGLTADVATIVAALPAPPKLLGN